jgi:transketolase N-terminal domain/subunit
MKRLLTGLTLFLLIAPVFSDELQNYKKDTESLWRTGSGAEDGTFTAISTSMLGWGLGLSVGIAVLASVLHQSTAAHAHTHCHD